MPKGSRAAVLIEFDADVNADAEGFKDKLKAAVRNGLHSEGWDDRFAKVVDVHQEGSSEPDDSKANQTESGKGQANKPAGQQ